jgi:hypothetical protein
VFEHKNTSSKDFTMNLLGMVPPYGTGLHRRNRLCDGCCVAWGFPVASLWVFNNDNGSAASCASNCTNNCGNNARNNEALRVGLFGSVAPLERYNRDQRDQSLANLQDKVHWHFSGIDDNDICLDKTFSHQRWDDVTCPGKLFFFGSNTIRRGYLD